MGVSLLEAIFGTSVDLGGLEKGLQKAERLAEEAAQKIANHFGIIGVTVGTAIAGAVLVSLEKAIKTTAEWGLEMEHLSNRMGVTAEQAATLVGVMEKFGIQAGVAARSMQIMAAEMRQTQQSIDPFATRMGKLLGTLRDASGQALNMAQVFDIARQKVSAAATDTEKLQIAQALVGTRMAGQLLPVLKLSNQEWEKQKDAVLGAIGPVDKAAEEALAYKQATAGLEQAIRGLQVELGTKLLPTLTNVVNAFTALTSAFRQFKTEHSTVIEFLKPWKAFQLLIDANTVAILYLAEKLHLVDAGTLSNYRNMEKFQAEAGKAAVETEKIQSAAEKLATEIELNEQNERKLVQIVKERVSLAEKARALGLTDEKDIQQQVQVALTQLEQQRKLLEQNLAAEGVTPAQRAKLEADIGKNRVEAAELVAKAVTDMYKEEELQIKAVGALNLSTELHLLETKLKDERIVGDERLKLEAEIFQKRRQFAEEAVKVGRELGFVSADQEIAYRKQRAAEAIGRGDVLGAAGEIVKAKDLALKQADQVFEFTKKIRIVSLQSEIEYQTQKLRFVKGNAEEEMKILSTIADLDKQLYDRRLTFALAYTQNAITAYRELQKATGQNSNDVSGPSESQTFAQAARETERARFEHARTLREVGQFGGTEEARDKAVKQSQEIIKQQEEVLQLGKRLTDGMKAEGQAAQGVLRAASGGEEVRAPGGPSPLIGSLLSPVEGLSTSSLARGSDIPRLDTSFTDLAVRVRDVILSAIPNIQNFSNAVADAARKITAITGFSLNPGTVGPGGGQTNLPTQGSGQLATSGSTATVAPGGIPVVPTSQVGVDSGGHSAVVSAITDLKKSIEDANKAFSDALQSQNAANQEQLANALAQVAAARSKVDVTFGLEPNTGDLFISRILQELA